MVGLTAGIVDRFRLNILKLLYKWQGSSSGSFGEIYRYVFVRFMSLCKSVCFIRGRGEPRVFVSSELGSVWRDMHVPVCLSTCFCGLNPRTVPQLCLKVQSTPRLRVCFFRSFGYFEWSTCIVKLDQAEVRRHNYVSHTHAHTDTQNAGTGFCASIYIYIFFFRCSRWCNITGQISCTVT